MYHLQNIRVSTSKTQRYNPRHSLQYTSTTPTILWEPLIFIFHCNETWIFHLFVFVFYLPEITFKFVGTSEYVFPRSTIHLHRHMFDKPLPAVVLLPSLSPPSSRKPFHTAVKTEASSTPTPTPTNTHTYTRVHARAPARLICGSFSPVHFTLKLTSGGAQSPFTLPLYELQTRLH